MEILDRLARNRAAWRRVGLLAAALALMAGSAPAPDRLPPEDGCSADPSFVRFRTDLAAGLARRDVSFLIEQLSDDIFVDLGGGRGVESFASEWELDRPLESALWETFGSVLELGCFIEDGVAYAPSLLRQISEDPEREFILLAVRPDSHLRAAPDESGEVVARLDWHVLTLLDEDMSAPWLRVRLADGRVGHVRREDVRSPTDYRASFEKLAGRWRVTAFLAGD